MKKLTTNSIIWNYIGKISTVILTLVAVIQLISWFNSNRNDYKAKITGEHTLFEFPCFYAEQIDSIDDKIFLNNEMWKFSIKNESNKPFEELSLEVPFDGYCKIEYPNNKVECQKFYNKIEIGVLNPTYVVNVICWRQGYHVLLSESDENKTRFTHKYGCFPIKYPIYTTKGIYVWIIKNDVIIFYTLFWLIGLLVSFFIIKFIIEMANSIKRKRKLKNVDNKNPLKDE